MKRLESLSNFQPMTLSLHLLRTEREKNFEKRMTNEEKGLLSNVSKWCGRLEVFRQMQRQLYNNVTLGGLLIIIQLFPFEWLRYDEKSHLKGSRRVGCGAR